MMGRAFLAPRTDMVAVLEQRGNTGLGYTHAMRPFENSLAKYILPRLVRVVSQLAKALAFQALIDGASLDMAWDENGDSEK